jgi:hypothetical protein
MTFRRQACLLVVFLGLGCSDATAPASAVNGDWTHDFQIPGNAFEMTLSTQGNVVSGSGRWTGEACCAGPVAVTGIVAGSVLTLDITLTDDGARVPRLTQHFEGLVLPFNTLSGTLTTNGQSMSYSYRRLR